MPAYQRGQELKKRRALMKDWARDQPGSAFAKLVDLRRVLTKPIA
jgi:hypothetical protein